MREIPSSLDPAVVGEIDRRLAGAELEHGVRILWAIESGSRAWGFPSPDSDYDCRFLFVRRHEDYLTLWPERDVIETPLDKVFDVNGWDLAKTLKLIVRGNATAVEWLRSPIVYAGDPVFRDDLVAFADQVIERSALGRHYLHVAIRQREGATTLKRFFYALRPAATLRWLQTHPESVVPPMDLPTLMAEGDLRADVHAAALELIEQKAVTREMGTGTPPELLNRFVTEQLEWGERFESMPREKDPSLVRSMADEFFLAQLTQVSPFVSTRTS